MCRNQKSDTTSIEWLNITIFAFLTAQNCELNAREILWLGICEFCACSVMRLVLNVLCACWRECDLIQIYFTRF